MDRNSLRRVLSLALLLMGCLPAIAGAAEALSAPAADAASAAQAGQAPVATAQAATTPPAATAAPATMTPTTAPAPASAAANDSTAPKATPAPAAATPTATEPKPAATKSAVDPLARRGEMRPDNEPVPDSVKVVLNQPAVEDIPLQINSDVLHYIEFFTGAGRSTFERWLKRSGRYMELFRTVLQKEGLPPDLVHLVFVESGFNLNARSYASAVGPWQFMRGSARLFGLNVNQWVDERKDPEKATVAAARYLKHLYGIFGDWPLAIASYNSGEGTVLRAIKAQGTTNYWDLKLPKQTEQYVPQFMAALAITRDPVKYGFSEVEFDDPMRFDEIAFNGNVDLRSVAKLCDCSVEDLRTLNPAYRGVAVKGTNGVSVVRVPEGKSELIHQRLADGAKLSAASVTVRHRVQRKETLRSIASEYSVSARRLAAANGIGRHHPLRRGMLLTIPASAPSAVPQVVDATDPSVSTAYVPPRKIGLPAHLSGNSNASNRTNHIVQKGETLYQIAQDAGVTAEQVQQWNHLKGTNLSVGQRLRVHSADDVAITEAAAASDSAQIAALHVSPRRGRHHGGRHHHGSTAYDDSGSSRHTVRSGETLGTIAKKYGVSVSALRRANGLRSSNVRAGQRLRVPGA
jgi:membrane-bound lytic murein transglycosylase D